jgi:hypothetical protein
MSEHTHDNNDQWAKENIEHMKFDFQDAYWDEMEQLLNQEEKRKRGFIWWWIGGGMAAVLIGLGLWMNFNPATNVLPALGKHSPVRNDDNFTTIPGVEGNDRKVEEVHEVNNQFIAANNSKSISQARQTESDLIPKVGKDDQFMEYTGDHTQSEEVELNDIGVTERIEMPKASLQSNSSGIHLAESNSIQLEHKPRTPFNSFVQLGVNLGYAGCSQISGGHASLGLYVNLEHGRKYFRSGLEMGMQGISGARYYEERQVYGLGSVVAFNEVSYKQTSQGSIPIFLGYSGLRHAVGVGVRANFLLNARAMVKEWNQPEANYEWGYSPGLREFWLSGGVEYQYAMTKRWAISAQLDCDMTSRFYSTLDSAPGRFFSGTIGLKYRLNN